MKRFFALFSAVLIASTLLFSGCGDGEIDRYKELQSAMKSNDMELSAAFLENASSFAEVSEFLKKWAGNAGFEVAADKDHYLVLKNPATEGMEDYPATTLQCNVDPLRIRQDSDLLSLAMASLLGPVMHGTIRLIVTENDESNLFEGANTLKKKNITDRHMIHLELGNSAMAYTQGPIAMSANLHCKAPRREPEYTSAYKITMTIPEKSSPYAFDQTSYPNPIEVIGNLLASAKSSGRLFEISSFDSTAENGYVPHSCTAVIVLDENNVENFMKRFDSSYETIEKRFSDIKEEMEKENKGSSETVDDPLFTFKITETDMPKTVLKQKGSDNIISLMYTLSTGIVDQDEETGEIQSISFIQSISTKDGRFNLNMKMRSRDEAIMNDLSSRYLITSGLCDVRYDPEKATRLWSSEENGALSTFFFNAVDAEKEVSPICLARSECDVLGPRGKNLDMIFYRVNKDHRDTAIKYILAYLAGEDVPE